MQAFMHSHLDVMDSRRLSNPESADFFHSTRAILFFGTPHYGTDWSFAHTMMIRFSSFISSTTTHIASSLDSHLPYLRQLHADFARVSGDLKLLYFYEELPTPVTVLSMTVSTRMLTLGMSTHFASS
jgi:hypothetical protein